MFSQLVCPSLYVCGVVHAKLFVCVFVFVCVCVCVYICVCVHVDLLLNGGVIFIRRMKKALYLHLIRRIGVWWSLL